MEHNKDIQVEREIDELKKELENFQKEKERIRVIIGSIGGMPKFQSKLFNWILLVATGVCLLTSIISNSTPIRLMMIELAFAMISIKILYLIHCQMRVNHFNLWVLSSLEWRVNELIRLVREKKKTDAPKDSQSPLKEDNDLSKQDPKNS